MACTLYPEDSVVNFRYNRQIEQVNIYIREKMECKTDEFNRNLPESNAFHFDGISMSHLSRPRGFLL